MARRAERISIIGASEADQRAWFAYLRDNGVNHIRGYWPVGAPLHLGPGGAEVVHSFFIDGQVNEPVVAALERTMAIGGEYGIGFTLTIADIARPLIAPQGRTPPGKTRREVAHESMDFLREFVPRLRFNPNVWAFELTNEQSWSIFEWSDRFVRTIKELDDETPVMISHWGGALQTADPQAWMRLTSIDIYQPHHYPDRGHSLWGPEVDSGLLQEVHYNGMAGPKPWMLGEAGGYGTHSPLGPAPDAETQRYLARDCIWFALLNRSLGASIWGILHDANTQFKVAAEVAPLVDWAALARAKAPVGVAVPRDTTGDLFFQSPEGKDALKNMADYARWALQHGLAIDFPLDAAGYGERRSALAAFEAPQTAAPFSVPPGYQLKYRATEDGTLVVGYLRNLAEIRLYRPETPAGSPGTVTGSWIRVRKPAAARLSWQLAAGNYTLSVWDLDTGAKTQADVPGPGGAWERGETDHDFVLVWRARR